MDEMDRIRLTQELMMYMRASDVWVLRAMEDGQIIQPNRLLYRTALRTLIDTVSTCDLDALAGIIIPDPPPYKKIL